MSSAIKIHDCSTQFFFFSPLYSSSTFPPNRRLEVEREGGRKEGRKGELDMGWGVGSFGIDVMVVRGVGGGERR